MTNELKLTSLTARTHDTSSTPGYRWKVTATIELPSKTWTRARNKKALGALYGIDISNLIYHLNPNIPAHNPMVDDKKRSSAGLKTITLTYYFNEPDRAEALGLEVRRWKSGETTAKYGDHVDLKVA